ncbi:MAG: hypothetical protein J7M21_02755, partial [Planctomycetes bacterium]|nr:hypothetical protein [Planctomycetota bacterium]
MRAYRRLVFPFLAVGLAVMLAGCRAESASDLAKATDRARRLYDRACGLLNDPVFKVAGKYVPLAEKVNVSDPNAVEPVPSGTINPKAVEAVKEAADALSAALKQSAGAPEADKIRAHAVLGRVYALRAYMLASRAARARRRAWTLLERMEQAAIVMADHGKRIANCDQMLAVKDTELDKMLQQAKAGQAAAQAKMSDLEKQIKTLEAEKASLKAANEKLLAEARKLRLDSRLADPIKGVDLFDQARAKEQKITANTLRIAEVEDTAEALRSQIDSLKLDVAAAAKRAAVAEKMAADRRQQTADLRKQRDGFVQLLAEAQKDVETFAGQAYASCTEAAKLGSQAVAMYDQASRQYEQYNR